MRELIEKDQRVTIIPSDFKYANKGVVTDVSSDGFILKLDYPADGILKDNYCEFYTDSKHGTLYFESYASEMRDDNIIKIANPAKHKFLQRRQFTRIKFIHNLTLSKDGRDYSVTSLDISAGGMKFQTKENIDIEGKYSVKIPLTEKLNIECYFAPIRIERGDEGLYTHSGRFEFKENLDRMELIQYCTRRSIEIKNK